MWGFLGVICPQLFYHKPRSFFFQFQFGVLCHFTKAWLLILLCAFFFPELKSSIRKDRRVCQRCHHFQDNPTNLKRGVHEHHALRIIMSSSHLPEDVEEDLGAFSHKYQHLKRPFFACFKFSVTALSQRGFLLLCMVCRTGRGLLVILEAPQKMFFVYKLIDPPY